MVNLLTIQSDFNFFGTLKQIFFRSPQSLFDFIEMKIEIFWMFTMQSVQLSTKTSGFVDFYSVCLIKIIGLICFKEKNDF